MRLENIWISPYMFLHFALITTYICVGTWTQGYHALVLPADTLYSWMYSLFPEYFLLMTKFSFQMRHDTVKPILNGHTIDSNLFCFRQLSIAQVYSTLVKDILNLVINTPYNRAVLGLFGLSTLVRFLAVPAALRDPSGGLVHYQRVSANAVKSQRAS